MPIIINYSNYYKGIREEAGAGEQDKIYLVEVVKEGLFE